MSAIDAIRIHVLAAENTYNELKRILANAEAAEATVAAAREKLIAAEEKAAAAKQEAVAARVAEETLLATAAAAAAEVAPPAVGTKFKWTSESNPETYRVAIVTKNGFLQVKSVTDGAGESDTMRTIDGKHPLIKKLFADEAAWRSSLPEGGKTEVSFSKKNAEAQRSEEVFAGLSDVEKVRALLKRYKIWHTVMQNRSPKQCLDDSVARLDHFRNRINSMTYDQIIAEGLFKSTRRGIQCLLNVYSWHRNRVAEAGADADKPHFHFGRSGTGAIYATINGQLHFITAFEDKIAAVSASGYWGPVSFYKNFAEMGNPALSVKYRKRFINI
jgi:hypothetical protein